MDLALLAETLGTVATALTSVVVALAAVYAFFRKRIARWWKPYRDGIAGAARVPHLEDGMNEMRGSLSLLHLRIAARANHSRVVECDFDVNRRMTSVNAALPRRMGVGKHDLQGFGYIGFIRPDERQRFRDEWKLCGDEHRIFDWTGHWVAANGDEVLMRWVMSPIPEPPEKPIQQWLGVGDFDTDDEEGP